MLSIKIAFRNLVAHRTRNFIIFLVTSIVSLFLFLLLSFSDGEIENIKLGVSSFSHPYADVKVTTMERVTVDNPMKGVSKIVQQIRENPKVKEAVARNWFLPGFALYANGKKTLNFGVVALSLDDETLRSRIEIQSGKTIGAGDRNSILIHSNSKKALGVEVGDEVTVVGKNYFGQVSSQRVIVSGFYTPLFDNPNLYGVLLVDTSAFSSLSGLGLDESVEILVRLVPGADVAQTKKELESNVRGPFNYLRFYLPSEDEFENGNTLVFGMVRWIIVTVVLITLLITAFGIMSVVSANLFDRKKEIGTYFCLGCEKPFLLSTYTIEIFVVNFFAVVFGIAVGLLVRWGINSLGITSSDPGVQMVMGGSRFTLGLSGSTIFWLLGGMSVLTLLTAMTSLGKALSVEPVEAVKETEG